jgi:hypothetical protein
MNRNLNQRLHEIISGHLGHISKVFVPGVKLTFLARHPTNPHAHVLVTEEEDVSNITEAIRRVMDSPNAEAFHSSTAPICEKCGAKLDTEERLRNHTCPL